MRGEKGEKGSTGGLVKYDSRASVAFFAELEFDCEVMRACEGITWPGCM